MSFIDFMFTLASFVIFIAGFVTGAKTQAWMTKGIAK